MKSIFDYSDGDYCYDMGSNMMMESGELHMVDCSHLKNDEDADFYLLVHWTRR